MTGRPSLELCLLGRFAARRDGVEIPAADFGGRKVRALVRMLAIRQGSAVGNDLLTEWLWPDGAPADPAANLQVLVNRARRALGEPGAVETGSGGYGLAASVRVDAVAFIAEVRRARELGGRDALAALRGALADWHGDPLPEDAYADWAQKFRDQMHRARQEALETAAQLALDAGDVVGAVDLATAAADADPLREVATVVLMRGLAAAGDPAAALSRYDALRRRLADELGVDPSGETVALYEQLLEGGARSTGPVEPPAARFRELPFISDGSGMEAIRARLEAARFGVVVVRGPSGSGKSRLLAELAHDTPVTVARAYEPESAEAFSFVRSLVREVFARDVLAADRLPAAMRAALASVVRETDVDAPPAALDAETRRALLTEAVVRLLDSLDGVVVAIDDAQWSDPTSIAVLAAARARLPGLRLVVVVRTDEPPPTHLAQLVSGPDVATIPMARLDAALLGRVVADEDLISALTDTTDGTPLAVNEVLRSLSRSAAIARGVDGRWHVAHDDTAAQARMIGAAGQRRAIAHRVALQPPPRQRLLEALALHGGEVAPTLLAAVVGRDVAAVQDDLAALHSAGLARIDETGWATAHDLLREAVAEAMSEPARVALHGALAIALDDVGADPAATARHWRAAREVDRAAYAYARAAQRALDAFADIEAVTLATAGLELDPAPTKAAHLREVRGKARARRGELTGARADLRAALAAAPPGAVRAARLGELAALAMGADDLQRASELAELAVVEAGAQPRARARALEIAAVLDMNLYRADRADERFAAALAEFQRLGDAGGTARVLDAIAMKTFIHGDVSGGRDALSRAANLFEDSGDLVRVVTPRSTAGHACVFAGDARAGLALTTAALEIARDLGHAAGQAYALWHRAEARTALDDTDGALEDGREALVLAQRIGHRGWTATAWRAVGLAELAAGNLAAARTAFEQSLESSEHLDLFASWAHARLGLVCIASDDLAAARTHVGHALRLGPPLGHYEARLAQVELAAAEGAAETAELAGAALEAARAGGVMQGTDRLTELVAQP